MGDLGVTPLAGVMAGIRRIRPSFPLEIDVPRRHCIRLKYVL